MTVTIDAPWLWFYWLLWALLFVVVGSDEGPRTERWYGFVMYALVISGVLGIVLTWVTL